MDRRADIWAFGVVVCEMLSGRPLFAGPTVSDTLAAVLKTDPDLSHVPPGIRPAVERCLQKDAQLRWRCIGDARVALEEGALAEPVAPLEIAANSISGAGQYDLSHSGMFLYLSGKASTNGLTVSSLDNNGTLRPLLSKGTNITPRFSPDGKRLAVSVNTSGDGELWVYDWQRDSMTQLTFHARVARNPVWTPDGKHLVLSALAASGSGYDIWWIRADGAGDLQVLEEAKGGALSPTSFSPDMKHLAYYDAAGQGGADIYILPLDMTDPDHPKPGTPEPFLRTSAGESEPEFSPDGRWLAYASDDTGTLEVYVRPYRAGAATGGRWRISTNGGKDPMWSRDGRQLLYRASDELIMVTACAAKGDSFDCGKPRRWSERRIPDPVQGYMRMLDLAPDGKSIAVVEDGAAAAAQQSSVHVTVFMNFFDELKRRMP